MTTNSKIEWTDHTFNPWWGCQRVSPGCEHCYAEAFAKRTGHAVWGPGDRRFFGDKHWALPAKWNAEAERDGVRRRVFCASMADVFEDRRDLDGPRARLFGEIARTGALDWQLLTKRPENVMRLAPPTWTNFGFPSNVWLGATVEDRQRANERCRALVAIPARRRFLSCEPLLESVAPEISIWLGGGAIHWVIVGGESGNGARPFELWWARDIVGLCKDNEVPVFVKQLGKEPMLDVGLVLRDRRKGGDITEWPHDLRVREFPIGVAT